MGKIEIDNMTQRMVMGRRGRARRGKYEGGRVPYGYTYDRETERLEIDAQEAAIVREIFARYERGAKVNHICRDLNLRGVSTKHPSRHGWHRSRIYEILNSPRYYGERHFARLIVSCPAIIDRATFERCQRIKEQNKQWSPRKLKQIYMLRRILYCEECGRSMRVETRYYRRRAKDGSGMERVPTTRAYRCRSFSSWPGSFDRCKPSSYVNAERIESLVWNELVELLRSPQMLNAGISGQMATLEESVNEAKSRAALLRKKLGGLERERHTVITWARTGRITEEDLMSQLPDLDERQKALQEDYGRAMEIAGMKADQLHAQRFAIEFCQHVSNKLDHLSSDPLTEDKLAARQELARMLLHRVWINGKGEVRIEGRIPKLEAESVFEYALPG